MIMEESVAQHCSGCGLRILDRYYLLAVDRQWHNDCLKCTICGIGLGNHLTCFARDGEIYCREDYTRRYSVNGSHRSSSSNGSDYPHHPAHEGRCGRCGNSIGSQELVMRAKELVFHLHCFVCVICLRVLNKGDHFGMRSSALYCAEHFELIEPRPPSPQPSFFNGAGSGQKGRPRKRNKEPQDVVLTTPCGDLMGTPPSESVGGVLRLVEGGGYESSSSSCPGGAAGQRTKRMRTSFKHHQLRTMKSYFGINQNPDAKDLKQLAQKTGLSKRVLQVWFQNARAKWRRNTMRNDSGGKSGGTTPTQHDSDLGQSTSSQDLLLQQTQLQNGLGSGSLIHHQSLSDNEGGFSNDIY